MVLREIPSAAQEISDLLWNLKVHYRTNESPTAIPILSHMNPLHISSRSRVTTACRVLRLRAEGTRPPRKDGNCEYSDQ
jgi:hypothetical protein